MTGAKRRGNIVHCLELEFGSFPAQRLDCGVTPADRAERHPYFARGNRIANFVADINSIVRRDPASSQNSPELARFAEERGPTGKMLKTRGILRAKDPADGRLGIGTHDPQHNAAALQFREHRCDAGEQFDFRVVARRGFAHPIHQERQFPFRKLEIIHYLLAREGAQLLVIGRFDPPKLQLARNPVDFIQEPKRRIRERPVEIEEREFKSHTARRSIRENRPRGNREMSGWPTGGVANEVVEVGRCRYLRGKSQQLGKTTKCPKAKCQGSVGGNSLA